MLENSPVSKNILRFAIPVALLLAGLGGFLALGTRRGVETRAEQQADVPRVETIAVLPLEGPLELMADGNVVPFRETTLAAEVEGRVETKSDGCQAGQFVEAGTVLLELDGRDYRFQIDQLESELEQAKAQIEESEEDLQNTLTQVDVAKDQLELAVKERERQQDLLRRGAAPEVDFEQARRGELEAQRDLFQQQSRARQIRSSLLRLEAAKRRAETMLEKAELDLSRAKIVAPFDGVVVEDMVEQDDYVQKGTALVQLEDTSKAEIECRLRMKQLYWIWGQQHGLTDTPVETLVRAAYEMPETEVTVVYTLEGHDYRWQGRLVGYDGLGLDSQTRTVPCRVVVDEPLRHKQKRQDEESGSTDSGGPPALVRGMYVTLVIKVDPGEALLRIPESALLPGNRLWRVADGELDLVDVDVATVLPETMVRPVALSDQGMTELVFREDVLTEELRRRLARDPLLTDQEKHRLLRRRVFRDREFRESVLEGAVLVRPAVGETLSQGDRIVVSPLAGARQGMPVRDGSKDEQAAAPDGVAAD